MELTYEFLLSVASKYPAAALALFIVLRSSSVVIPPVPGFPMDIMAINLYGPLCGFFLAEAGIMLGAALAFAFARIGRGRLGRGYRATTDVRVHQSVVNGLVPEKDPHIEFVRWFVIRLLTNPLFDALSYGAGFGTTRFTAYILGSLLGNVPSTAIFFLLHRDAAMAGTWTLVFRTISFLSVAWVIAAKFLERSTSRAR